MSTKGDNFCRVANDDDSSIELVRDYLNQAGYMISHQDQQIADLRSEVDMLRQLISELEGQVVVDHRVVV